VETKDYFVNIVCSEFQCVQALVQQKTSKLQFNEEIRKNHFIC